MQTIRRKGYKQYFVAGVLLLSLSANIIKCVDQLTDAALVKAAEAHAQKLLIGKLAKVVMAPFFAQMIPYYIGHWFEKRPQMVIRSSKDNRAKPNQEMIFSDEVESKLDDFFVIAKKTNEKIKSDGSAQNIMEKMIWHK